MEILITEPYNEAEKIADDALEELNGLGLGYGAHTVIGMALGKLKAYESTGLTPEQIREIDKLCAEKCREVSRIRQNHCALEPRLLEEIGKKMFAADVYNKDFNGREINNLLCFGDVAEIIDAIFEENQS